MKFPQYRKYKNNLSFFKILSNENFTEWKKQPNGWEKIEFKAKILPDRVFISDMLNEPSDYWDSMTEIDFNKFITSI